ncbi:MAG: DUF882 domain-containing protein [Nitratireductor sp.]|nr:DUF882 domain-containing protein [Nitratireductor sp.]MCB1456806.1 DUF882 domain-containing protein [Nitratireductor sp.]MCB1459561.1 DUF882 domain-containing protein [Nitratireductor sp.]
MTGRGTAPCCPPAITRQKAVAMAASTLVLLVLGGCVSSVAPLGADVQSMQPVALNVAGTDTSASGPISEVASVETSGSFGQQAEAASVREQASDGSGSPLEPEVAIASIIPTPAPRTSDPGGVAMAFASTDDTAVAADETVAAATAPDTEPVSQQAAIQPPTTPPPAAKPKSLFEILFARRQSAPAQTNTRVASLAPTAPVAASASRLEPAAGTVALPGVKDNNSLFHTTDEDESGDASGLQLASAGAMSRMSPLGIVTQTDRVEVGCFKPELIAILGRVERHYGRKPIVTSGYRNPAENRRAGGARKSMHMLCQAADIQVEGVSKWDLAKYLRTVEGRGGVGTYCRTNSVHIDTGEERDWHYPCRRKKKKRA